MFRLFAQRNKVAISKSNGAEKQGDGESQSSRQGQKKREEEAKKKEQEEAKRKKLEEEAKKKEQEEAKAKKLEKAAKKQKLEEEAKKKPKAKTKASEEEADKEQEEEEAEEESEKAQDPCVEPLWPGTAEEEGSREKGEEKKVEEMAAEKKAEEKKAPEKKGKDQKAEEKAAEKKAEENQAEEKQAEEKTAEKAEEKKEEEAKEKPKAKAKAKPRAKKEKVEEEEAKKEEEVKEEAKTEDLEEDLDEDEAWREMPKAMAQVLKHLKLKPGQMPTADQIGALPIKLRNMAFTCLSYLFRTRPELTSKKAEYAKCQNDSQRREFMAQFIVDAKAQGAEKAANTATVVTNTKTDVADEYWLTIKQLASPQWFNDEEHALLYSTTAKSRPHESKGLATAGVLQYAYTKSHLSKATGKGESTSLTNTAKVDEQAYGELRSRMLGGSSSSKGPKAIKNEPSAGATKVKKEPGEGAAEPKAKRAKADPGEKANPKLKKAVAEINGWQFHIPMMCELAKGQGMQQVGAALDADCQAIAAKYKKLSPSDENVDSFKADLASFWKSRMKPIMTLLGYNMSDHPYNPLDIGQAEHNT